MVKRSDLPKNLLRKTPFRDGEELDFDEDPLRPPFWTRVKRRFRRRRLEVMVDELGNRPGLWVRFKQLFRRRRLEVMTEALEPAILRRQETYKRHRRLTMLGASPSLFVAIAVGALVYRGSVVQSAIQVDYRNAGRAAFEEGSLKRAQFYYSRLIGEGDLGSPQDQLNWASMLASSGDSQAAMSLLDKLAPEKSIGFGPAHRQKALLLLNAMRAGQTQGSDILNRLQWHLKQGARDESVESHQLWAFYFLAAGQLDKAIARLVRAAQINPDLWLETAALCSTPNHAEDRARFIDRAEAHARQSIETNPLDAARRVTLAKVLVERRQFDEAEAILLEGLKLENLPGLRRACSDLCLVRLQQLLTSSDVSDSGGVAMGDQVRLIGQATQYDPQNPEVIKQWAALHDRATSDDHRKQIREQLEKSIVEGESAAFAHFTLGGILWIVGDRKKSIFHVEKAFAIDPRFTDAANNLAWMLANQDTPDLDRAEELILQALAKRPEDVRYQDTYSDVLTKQGKWDEALVVLEKVLPAMPKEARKDLHQRLAKVYSELGEEVLSKMHQENAGKM